MANSYEVQPDVALRIQTIGGNLVIEGQPESEIRVRGDKPLVQVDEDGHTATLSCGGDCRVRVPNGASLSIQSIGGDARITDIEGTIAITSISGDLVIRNTGDVAITSIGGDVVFKRISGSVQVTSIGGDADLRQINGAVRIESIGSDALIEGVSGDCKIGHIGSDLVLNTRFKPSASYHFATIGSDMLIRVHPEDDVRFIIPQHVERTIDVRNARVETNDDLDSIIVGNGTAVVQIENLGSDLTLVNEDRADFGAFFEDMIPENLEEIINEQLDKHIPDIQRKAERAAERLRQQAEREAEKAQHHAERIRQEAERKAERMRQAAERHAERARRDAERMAEHGKHKRGFGFEFSWPGPIPPIPPIPPMPFGFRGEKPKRDAGPVRPPVEPVSNEERMTILRMVENKQITVEEAERLLAALEGQE